jgi:plasmid stabilization system protein ParE
VEPKQGWNVQLSQQAECDFSEILKWTAEKFGLQQANEYAETLLLAIGAQWAQRKTFRCVSRG